MEKIKESKFHPKAAADDIDAYFKDVFYGFARSFEKAKGFLPAVTEKKPE